MNCCCSSGEHLEEGERTGQASEVGSSSVLSKFGLGRNSGCCTSPGLSCVCGTRTKWRITIEPVVMLYMLPTFMLLPILQDLIYTKVCLSLFTSSVCSRLNESANSAALDAVQSQSAHWIQASTILMCLPSMIVGQLLGTYSDAISRKLPLLGPPLGGVAACLVYVMVSGSVLELHVSWILLASFLTGLGGAWPACLNTCSSYLTQVSPPSSRTSRVGILECMNLVGASVGPLLAGALQQRFSRAAAFTVMLAMHASNVLYVLAFVPPLHASRHVSRLCPSERGVGGGVTRNGGLVTSTWQRLKQMFGVLCKARHENRKTYLLGLILAAAVIMFCTTGQLDILYLFLKDPPLQWSLVQYTRLSTLSFSMGLASLLLVFMPLSRCVGDATLLAAGALSRLTSLLLLGLAVNDEMVYSAAVAGCAFSWCLPSIRSAMSKLVEPDELGRVFGLFGIVENACALLASSVFTSLYPVAREAHGGAVFLGAAAMMAVPVVVAGLLYRPFKRLSRYSVMESEEDEPSNPPGITAGTEDVADTNTQAELSLGIPGINEGGSVAPATPQRGAGSISLSSSSSSSSAITPITPPSASSLIVEGTHFPAIVDTNFSTVPEASIGCEEGSERFMTRNGEGNELTSSSQGVKGTNR